MRLAARAYVEAIRNTPLLVQLFIVFFGLPSIGIRLGANTAALIALSINMGAYGAEILRAGFESVRPSQIEAGRSLGLTAGQTFRHVVLFQAVKSIYPALASQFVLIMLTTSVVSSIGATELFHQAAFIDSRTYRSFETYTLITLSYLVLTLGFRAFFAAIYWAVFVRRPTPMIREFGGVDVVYLIAAARWTVLLALTAMVGGGLLGVIVAVLRVVPFKPLNWLAIGYINLIQGTPLLGQLFIFFFGLPLIGLSVDAWTAAALSLSIYASAFFGEIWRGSLQSVSQRQWEAGAALGLTYAQRLGHVVLPQAIRISIAPTVGFLVQLVKNTSLTALIGFVELTRASQIISGATFAPLPVYLTAAAIYFVICFSLSQLARVLERRLHVAR